MRERKRDHTGKLKRHRKRSLYQEFNIPISETRWSTKEKFLLHFISKYLSENFNYFAKKTVFDIYCKMLHYFKNNDVRRKTLHQIECKMTHFDAMKNPFGE